MAIWKITCPDCEHCEEVRIDIDDFSETEQTEFLRKFRPKEILLRIHLDELDKLRYALNHVQLTGDEHIDAVLSTFNDVLKESPLTHDESACPKRPIPRAKATRHP